jgi:hypothetical protein
LELDADAGTRVDELAERRGLEGPLIVVRTGQVEGRDHGHDVTQHARRILVAGAPEDDGERAIGMAGPDGAKDRKDRLGRVGAVDDDRRVLSDDLRARAVGCSRQPRGDAVLRDPRQRRIVRRFLTQRREHREHEREIHRLVLTGQGHGHGAELQPPRAEPDPVWRRREGVAPLDADGHFLAQNGERARDDPGLSPEAFDHARGLRDRERRDARLEDAGLLARDEFERAAEDLSVLELDGGDRDCVGRDDIGRVQPSAEADLDDGDVNPGPHEVPEGHRGEHLKVRRGPVMAGQDGVDAFDLGPRPGELGGRDHHAVHSDPFADIDDVGAGVEPDAPAAPDEGGGGHLAHRPLALGSRDVNRAEGPLGMAQGGHHGPHP